MGNAPCVQSKLSRSLYPYSGNERLQNLLNPDNAAMTRAMVRFRGAWKEGAKAFREGLGVSQEDTVETQTRHLARVTRGKDAS